MAISDELGRLGELHQRGTLSDDEFARAKARVLDDTARVRPASASASSSTSAINGLQRSRSDRWLGGVCGGLAQTMGVAAWVWRLMLTLLVLCAGTGALVYVLLWILVPEEPAPIDSREFA